MESTVGNSWGHMHKLNSQVGLAAKTPSRSLIGMSRGVASSGPSLFPPLH